MDASGEIPWILQEYTVMRMFHEKLGISATEYMKLDPKFRHQILVVMAAEIEAQKTAAQSIESGPQTAGPPPVPKNLPPGIHR